MNISKNILSLGLIAVISGISTAQTYTATAGTNGITDIQSDYSMSTGDGASVSVEVPLEFELPKKIAIAVCPSGTATLPNNSIFQGITLVENAPAYISSKTLDTTPFNSTSMNNLSKSSLGLVGAIYANTAINISMDVTDFVHESDPNSTFKGSERLSVHNKDDRSIEYIRTVFNNDSSVNDFPLSRNIDDSMLIDTENRLGFFFYSFALLDTIDAADRAGKYTQLATITISTL